MAVSPLRVYVWLCDSALDQVFKKYCRCAETGSYCHGRLASGLVTT